MIAGRYLNALQAICTRLEGGEIVWAITGSAGMALQGVPLAVHDIDVQTDRDGAYEIEEHFSPCVVTPVRYVASERIRSHLGALEIAGVRVEVMGDVQKRRDDGRWEVPVDVARYRRWTKVGDLQVPVLSLVYEYRAYRALGRSERASTLRRWLQRQGPDPAALEREGVQPVHVMALRPNNWFINVARLERVREAWRRGLQDTLPPVLVTEIDGGLSLIDGHARTYAAYERGETHVRALVRDLEEIEGSEALYRHIHRVGPARGIETIADLAERIVAPEVHTRLWVGYCDRWLAAHETQ
ncbi:MAG: ParB N-terminal domain-containing protein [Anaerolineae bacterium]